ncbi:putative reverse transcriptase domain-containing protein [Tanacetum coccineum]
MSVAAISKLVADKVAEALAADRATRNNSNVAGGSGGNGGQGGAPPVRKRTFAGFMKCGPTQFHGNERVVKLCCWFEKTESVFGIIVTLGLDVANGKSWTDMRKMMMEELCLMNRFKGETTPLGLRAVLNDVVRMAHTLMEQKIQDKAERVAESNKIKWESNNNQGGGSNNNRNKNCCNNNRGNYRDNNRHNQYNNRRQGSARAMTTAQNDGVDQGGPAPNCNRYGLCHFGPCSPKCNRCGKTGHRTNDYSKRTVATGANTQPIRACYEDAKQGQGPNIVTGTFLLNNRYATIVFDSGSDKSFINTSFSHLIDIKSVRLNTSYEVELTDGKIVSTNTVLRGCTQNLINHLFEIDLMPIELGTFDIVIGMDWLVERDAVIVCGKKEVHIPIKNEVLVVKGNKGVSRLKVISCIKARKYMEKGSQLFLAQVTEKEL